MAKLSPSLDFNGNRVYFWFLFCDLDFVNYFLLAGIYDYFGKQNLEKNRCIYEVRIKKYWKQLRGWEGRNTGPKAKSGHQVSNYFHCATSGTTLVLIFLFPKYSWQDQEIRKKRNRLNKKPKKETASTLTPVLCMNTIPKQLSL